MIKKLRIAHFICLSLGILVAITIVALGFSNSSRSEGFSLFVHQSSGTEFSLLGFYEDGTVIMVPIGGSAGGDEMHRAVARWFNRYRDGTSIGTYTIEESEITFSLGRSIYTGTIIGSERKIFHIEHGNGVIRPEVVFEYVGRIVNGEFICAGREIEWPFSAPVRTGEYLEFDCYGCSSHKFPIYEPQVHDVDYTIEYADILNAMFNDDWTILLEEEMYEALDREEFIRYFMCHLAHQHRFCVSSTQYLQWTIEYQNWNGDSSLFVLNNRSHRGFFGQLESHIRASIAEYYQEHFLEIYMANLQGISYNISVSFVTGNHSWDSDKHREGTSTVKEYKRWLATFEGMIHLSKITPENAFDIAPVYFYIRVTLPEDFDLEQQEEYLRERIEAMIEAMNKHTSNNLRAMVAVFPEGEGYRSFRYWIQGEWVYLDHPFAFPWYVFESYRGIHFD